MMPKSQIERIALALAVCLRYRAHWLVKFGPASVLDTRGLLRPLWTLMELLHAAVLTATSISLLLVSP